jgi:hypothetical protein
LYLCYGPVCSGSYSGGLGLDSRPRDKTLTLVLWCVSQCFQVRSGIQYIPDWCRHLYSSCGSAKHRSQQAKLWIPGSTATFCSDYVKACEDVAPNLARTDLAASQWQRPVSHFCPHPAVSGKIINGCHPPLTVLPWFGTLWLLSTSKNEIEAERTPVW